MVILSWMGSRPDTTSFRKDFAPERMESAGWREDEWPAFNLGVWVWAGAGVRIEVWVRVEVEVGDVWVGVE